MSKNEKVRVAYKQVLDEMKQKYDFEFLQDYFYQDYIYFMSFSYCGKKYHYNNNIMMTESIERQQGAFKLFLIEIVRGERK